MFFLQLTFKKLNISAKNSHLEILSGLMNFLDQSVLLASLCVRAKF